MSSAIYYLKNFNNYYNRVIKRYDSISDYLQDVGEGNYALRGDSQNALFGNKGPVNFNINDGVTATITYNYQLSEDWQPDYIVVCEIDATTIKSRWFVMEATRTRKGQYIITLRRDVIADNYSNLLTSPIFIEKGTLNTNDDFIFNSENMTYNEIKDPTEVLLKDDTNSSWIVGYVSNPQDKESDIPINTKYDNEVDIQTNSSIDSYLNTHSYKTSYILEPSNWSYSLSVEGKTLGSTGGFDYKWCLDDTVETTYTIPGSCYYRENGTTSEMKSQTRTRFITNGISSTTINAIDTLTGKRFIQRTSLDYLMSINNKVISASDGIYRISITNKSETITTDISRSNAASIYNGLIDVCGAFKRGSSDTPVTSFELTGSNVSKYTVSYEELDGTYITVHSGIASNRKSLNDAPYCMFCIPFDKVSIKYEDGTVEMSDEKACFAIARAAAEALGSKLYDLQLLPYCPRRDLIGTSNAIDLTLNTLTPGYDYTIIYSGELDAKGVLLWCSNSQDSFNIQHEITVPTDNIEFKVENETTFYRLQSPNYAGTFQFKPTMNNGVDFFNVDYCYKPYNPYIHVNPNFGRLYGVDNNDSRGLICGGDFSLPQTTDAFKQYEINNKNYQQSFNRSITNMEVKQDIQYKEFAWQSMAGIAQGVAGGASSGAMVGGGYGAVAGAVVGGAGALYGTYLDNQNIQTLQKEAINYEKDQFGFQMGNIKAQPDTLGKVSAYNPNNKVFPFLEKWSCTQKEKDALKLKLHYNGMTVGRIDYISNFLRPNETYIKGKIIRIEGLSDDFHMTTIVAEELNKGVFIK